MKPPTVILTSYLADSDKRETHGVCTLTIAERVAVNLCRSWVRDKGEGEIHIDSIYDCVEVKVSGETRFVVQWHRVDVLTLRTKFD